MTQIQHLVRQTCPLNTKLIADIRQKALEASVQAVTGGIYASGPAMIIGEDRSIRDARLLAAPIMAFAAAELLHAQGRTACVVAGAAMWSVGRGNLDTLDHGVARHSTPRQDVARGDFHTWLTCDGWLFDFAACTLPVKLNQANAVQPFSSPRRRWRRFPETIVHNLNCPMPDPRRDVRAPYGYYPRGPNLLASVRGSLEQLVSEAEARARSLAGRAPSPYVAWLGSRRDTV